MSTLYMRDGMGSYDDEGLQSLDDGGTNAALAHQFQCVYQDLGLDPLVTNLALDRVHPTMRELAQATSANAASSLMALKENVPHVQASSAGQKGPPARRPEIESPTKRARTTNISVFAKRTIQSETPVRERVDVDASPECSQILSGFESPDAYHGSSYSTPCQTGAAQTPPQSPYKKLSEENAMHYEAVTILANGPQNGRSHGTPLANSNIDGPEDSADSDEEPDSPPPSKGKGKSRPGRVTQSYLAPVDKNKKDKGLREFSLRVCRQVEAKMMTTYNEVADELVKEFKNNDPAGDEKNIRRRAYDALNVLTAMDIIAKDKKDIQWKGFPHLTSEGGGSTSGGRGGFATSGESEKQRLKTEIALKQNEIVQKENQLEDLAIQYLSLMQLLKRNEQPEVRDETNKHRIYLPFVLVSTNAENTIECDISEDKQTAQFNFTKPFELFDDRETLNMMNMHVCDNASLEEHLVPHVASFLKQRRSDVLVDQAKTELGYRFKQEPGEGDEEGQF